MKLYPFMDDFNLLGLHTAPMHFQLGEDWVLLDEINLAPQALHRVLDLEESCPDLSPVTHTVQIFILV